MLTQVADEHLVGVVSRAHGEVLALAALGGAVGGVVDLVAGDVHTGHQRVVEVAVVVVLHALSRVGSNRGTRGVGGDCTGAHAHEW